MNPINRFKTVKVTHHTHPMNSNTNYLEDAIQKHQREGWSMWNFSIDHFENDAFKATILWVKDPD